MGCVALWEDFIQKRAPELLFLLLLEIFLLYGENIKSKNMNPAPPLPLPAPPPPSSTPLSLAFPEHFHRESVRARSLISSGTHCHGVNLL